MYNIVITRTPVFSIGAEVPYAMAKADELYFLRQSVTGEVRQREGLVTSFLLHGALLTVLVR
jgi:hypothetical protein